MGVSSYITADTHRSIPVAELAPCPTFTVYMVGPPKEGEQRMFLEDDYAGYQRFGGMSVPEFAAQINGVPAEGIGSMSREDIGWILLYGEGAVPGFEWKLPLVYPQFVENPEMVKEVDFHLPPKFCPNQGWFLEPDDQGRRSIKTTIGKILYVNVERVSLVDGFEIHAPYCQLTGERQVVIDAECFEVGFKEGQFNQPPELRKAAEEIAKAIEVENPGEINIYC